MKYPLLLLLPLLLFSCQQKSGKKNQTAPKHNYDYYVKVVGISDGDTFTGLTENNEQIRFRIYAIDAPEKSQAFGNKSKQYLSDLIYGKTVGIIVQKKSDRYGRSIVWVYTPEDKDVSAEMLKAGMAWHYKQYDASPHYANIENQAKQNKKGLWIDKQPIPPWEYRKPSR